VTAVIGVVVSLNVDAIKSWFSTRESIRDPLGVYVNSDGSLDPTSYLMVVPDPSRLPEDVGHINECSALWDVGLTAGGIRIPERSFHRILLQGKANDGVAIIDIRARVTRREPAINGALLFCPSEGELDPIGLQFDLRSHDVAPAKHFNPDSHDEVSQFARGYTISVAKNESVPLDTEATLPDDAVYWHIEVELIVGGGHRTLIIDDNGKDFFSPGSRPVNNYSKGYGAGVYPQDWGIDNHAHHIQLSGGIEALQFGSAIFPNANGLDVYQPQDSQWLDEPSPYRWIRRDGRKVLEFNPDGVPALPVPATGNPCHSGVYTGNIVSQNLVGSLVRDHDGQPFMHLVVDYTCQLYYRPEQTYRFQATWHINGTTMFSFSSSDVADEDLEFAERLLNEIQIGQ